MRRRDVLGLGLAMIVPRGAPAETLPVVGFLNSAAAESWGPYLAAFRAGLNEAGYVEGRNVALEFRWAEGDYNRLPALAAELVQRRVSVIAATGGVIAAQAAVAATRTVPVVFSSGSDPVRLGLVASFSRPGGNATGVSLVTSELMPKRLELLREVIPAAREIALLINPGSPGSVVVQLPELEAALRATDQRVAVLEARGADEIERAFARLAERRPDALLVGSDAFFSSQREQIVGLAARHRLPAMYEWPEYVTVGGLMSYGPSLRDAYRQVGVYVGRILAGASPADLPVQQPTRFELYINAATARALGLALPQTLLDRADEVIE